MDAIKKETEDRNKAADDKYEQQAWDLWVSIFPKMRTGEIEAISFEDFKQNVFVKKSKIASETTKLSYEEIEKEMDKVVKAYESGVR